MISLDAKGAVFTGSGPSKTTMDSDPTDHALPKLNSTLELYSNAAKAAASQPGCMVYADPAVDYQRVIDLFSSFHTHGIIVNRFIGLNDEIETTQEGAGEGQRLEHFEKKPNSPGPSSMIRPIEK